MTGRGQSGLPWFLFRYVEWRVRHHAHNRSVAGLQANLANAGRSGWQTPTGSSDLRSGRVGLNVRDLDVRIRETESLHQAATHAGSRQDELDNLDAMETGSLEGQSKRTPGLRAVDYTFQTASSKVTP